MNQDFIVGFIGGSTNKVEAIQVKTDSSYEKDFVAWADEQALLLEQQRYNELDLANLVEEVRDLGNRHRDAIESQLTRLLKHLLKWQYQPEQRCGSWSGTIREARKQIARSLRQHPVLAPHLQTVLEQCYMDAREDAADDTGLPIEIFPIACQYWLKGQILNREFFPEPEESKLGNEIYSDPLEPSAGTST